MSYVFVGEGNNDELVVPIVLQKHGLNCEKSDFVTWKSLHQRNRRGFRKKAKFAFILARLQGVEGVVITLDADNQPARLNELKAARDEDRADVANQRIRIVVGQANPELEAWLLDDSEAVKSGLSLSAQTQVQSPKDVPDVKAALDQLFRESNLAECREDCLAAVAGQVRLANSRDPKTTGLSAFLEDAKAELS